MQVTTRHPRPSVARALSLSVASLTCCALVLAGAPTLSAQRGGEPRYDVRFHRPVAVGARARVELTGTKQITMERVNGRNRESVRDESVQVRFVAVERVTAVNAIGKATTLEYTVEAFELTRDGARSTPLPAGTVLTLERATQPGGDGHMRVNGRDVAEEVAEALSIVLSRSATDTTDDEVFGSQTQRRVGERWSVNAAAAQRDLAASGAPDMRLRGEVRATDLTTVDTLPCLTLTASIQGQLRGLPNLPPSATFRSGTMQMNATGAFPVDGTTRPPTGRLSVVLDVNFSVSAQGQTQNFHMEVREERSEHLTVLP